MKTLGEQVEAFRKARGWNTTAMAEAVGTKRQNIEQLEASGNRIPKYLGALAAAMEASADEMLVAAGLAPQKLLRAGRKWPLSAELAEAVFALDDEGLLRLENVMRAHLGIPMLSGPRPTTPSDRPHTPFAQVPEPKRPIVVSATRRPRKSA
jgi:transcriptional regulator with XRE-family HTH domain